MANATGSSGTIHSWTEELEAEARRLVGYLNDEVVPRIRRESSTVLRAAAVEMDRWAEYLDRGPKWRGNGEPAPAPSDRSR